MKKLLMSGFLVLLAYMCVYAQDSRPEQLALGIFGGIKLPENDIYLDSGPWFGVAVIIPTGLGWSIQPEYNFWETNYDSIIPGEDLFVSEWSLLVAHKWYLNKIFIQPLAGPGIASSGNSWFGGDREFLVSFNAALKIGLGITKGTDGFLLFKKHWSGSLSAGGGSSYSPWLIGIGFQYKFN